jgi:DNA invertase Pin-like site-specific DNA recombinase
MKTGIYCRTSTTLAEFSIPQQRKAGIDFCKSKNWDFEVYEDEGKSGYKTSDDDSNIFKNQPALSSLINDIENKKITRVWVWERERLSRNTFHWANINRDFEKYKIELWVLDKKIEINDPEYKMINGVLEHLTEYSRHKIVSRTWRGIKDLIDRGERSYQAFYGYEAIGKDMKGKTKWQKVDSKLNIVKFTYQELLKGSSYKKILYSLYDNRFVSLEEYKSLQRKLVQIIRHFEYTGFTWTYEGSQIYKKIVKGEITDIMSLNNPKYYVECLAYSEKIISIKDWFFIFEKNIIRKRVIDARKETHLKTASTGMSTGIIECPLCGFKFYNFNGGINPKTKTEYRYLKHHAAFLKTGYCQQKPKSFKSETIDEIFKIFFFMNKIVYDDSEEQRNELLFKIQQEITVKNEKLKKVADAIAKNEKRLKKFNEMHDEADDKETMKFYLKKIQEKEAEIDLLTKTKTEMIVEQEKMALKYSGIEREKAYYNVKETVHDFFTKFNEEEKRTLLIESVKKCYAYGKNIIISTNYICYLFDTSLEIKFNEALLDNLEKDEIYKNFFVNPDKREPRKYIIPAHREIDIISDDRLFIEADMKNKQDNWETTQYFKSQKIDYDISNFEKVVLLF